VVALTGAADAADSTGVLVPATDITAVASAVIAVTADRRAVRS